MTITKVINGVSTVIELTTEDIMEINRQQNIQLAKDILANYADVLVDYDNIILNDDILNRYTTRLHEKEHEDNGVIEIETMEEMFTIIEWVGFRILEQITMYNNVVTWYNKEVKKCRDKIGETNVV